MTHCVPLFTLISEVEIQLFKHEKDKTLLFLSSHILFCQLYKFC